MAEQSAVPGYDPNSIVEVSSEQTPINVPSIKDSFNTDFNDLVTTVAVSEITDTIEG